MNMLHKSLICLSLLYLAALSARAQQAGPDYQAAGKYTFGQDRSALANIDAEIRKTAPAGYPAIEAKLLALLQAADTTVDAKRIICRQLMVVGSGKSAPALAALLTDENLSHPARYALQPMADPAASAVLRQALPKVKGKLLVGVIGSIGIRRDPAALEALSGLAGDADLAIASAALLAIGQVGNAQAAQGLQILSGKVAPALGPTLAIAQIQCAACLTQAGQGKEAIATYTALMNPSQTSAIRIASLKGLIAAQPPTAAAKLMIDTLQGDDAVLRTATIAAYCALSTDKAVKDAVAAQLPTLKPAGQLVLLNVLADLPDVAARASLLQVLQASQQEEIQVATIDVLGTHGQTADVAMLVSLAAKGDAAIPTSARKALEKLGKPGVNEALIDLAQKGATPARVICMKVLATRHADAAIPALLTMASQSDLAIATAAVNTLSTLAKVDQLAALAGLIASATDDGLRSAAENAVKTVISRTADKQAAADAVLPVLAAAKTPAARQALLHVLPRLGNQAALVALRGAMNDTNPQVAETATRELAGWADMTAAPYLLDLAKTSPNPTHAVLAIRGYMRLAALKDQPLEVRFGMLSQAIETAKRIDEKKLALAGLAEVPTIKSLGLLQSLLKDQALGQDAANAAIRLCQQLGPVQPKVALTALKDIRAQVTTDALKQLADKVITEVEKSGQLADGFIIAWLVAGPFTQEGADGAKLFDVKFAPESGDTGVAWRPMALAPEGKDRRIIDFAPTMPGNDRAAYLKTIVTSPAAMDATLEMGSDDGVKVFLNGKQIYANNSVRPCTPGSDKVKIKLNAGANTLLLKITQGGGQWEACARIVGADGKVADLIISPE